MNKSSIIFFVFLTLIFNLTAQTITFKGRVTDSLQKLLPYANVLAKPLEKNKNLKFAITDDGGQYRFELTKNSKYTISISYMGYKSINYSFTATENITKNFVMLEDANQLEEVLIEMPVVVRGDTTTYNTNKFVTGDERKLKDILKKIPGVEVDKKGKVTVQGKKITHLLVDGKMFFGGGSKLAVENIPADAVANIDVIDNYNEISFLKGLDDSDDMAMNINLKKDKKNFVFGDIETGKGNEKHFKTHANLFYYSPKTNVNFIGNINDIGEKTFTFEDYMSFQGGVNSVLSSDFKWNAGGLFQFMENNDLLKSKQQFGALNIVKTTSRILAVSSYLIFSKTATENRIESSNQYTSFIEDKTNSQVADNMLGIGKLSIDFTPSTISKGIFRTQVKRTNQASNRLISSTINFNNTNINTLREGKNTNVNQSIEWHQKINKNHTFSSVIDYTFNTNNPNTYWQMSKPISHGVIPIDVFQKTIRLQQDKELKSHQLNVAFKHFWVLHRKHHIYTTIGNNLKKEKFHTNTLQLLDNQTEKTFETAGFTNRLSYQFNDTYLGMHYKFQTGIFVFKQGAYLHKYHWEINHKKQDKWAILPSFLMKIKFNKSKNLQLSYKMKSSFSEVATLANRYYLQSYNSVVKGNENLENNRYHAAHLYYSRFNLYRGLILHGSINYDKKIEEVRSTVMFDNVSQLVTYKMFHNPSQSFRMRGSVRKQIKKLRYAFSTNVSLTSYKQEIDSKLQTNKNKTYSLGLSVETLFKNFPTIEFGYERNIGNFTSNNTNSKFISNEPFVAIDYDFLKGFVFSFDYKYYDYQNKTKGIQNSYQLANTSFSYKKEGGAWSYKIAVNNLFNIAYKQSNSFSYYIISDTKTYVMPRVFMFSIAYNL